MGRRWSAALVVAALCAASFGLGWVVEPAERLTANTYGGERLHVINAHLRQVAAPYVFLVGDSLAEHALPERLPCGREIVNGGVSGQKIADTLQIVPRLAFPARPAVALVSSGLNDLLGKHDPMSAASTKRYVGDLEQLVTSLSQGGTTKVLVTAVPPVYEDLSRYFDRAAFRAYSDSAKALCGRIGCTFVDPFAAYRTEAFWIAKPGSSNDGLHLADLRGAYRSIAAELCR